MEKEFPVKCPRCQEPVRYSPSGAFVSFCVRCVAFLLPQEFTPEDLKTLTASVNN
jgi:hypothetical protein